MHFQQSIGWVLLACCGIAGGCTPPSAAPLAPSSAAPAPPSTVARSDKSPPNEFDESTLIVTSARLTGLILNGDTTAAQQLFSPPFREHISAQSIGSLSAELREELGEQVTSIQFLNTHMGGFDEESQAEEFLVRHLIKFERGKQAISTVQFFLPLEPSQDQSAEMAAELAAIDIRQTWPSFSPTTLSTAQAVLQLLFAPTEAHPNDAESTGQSLMGHFHPDIVGRWQQSEQSNDVMKAKLDSLIAATRRHLGPLRATPNWLDWSYQTFEGNLTVRGEILTQRAPANIQLDFTNDQLIGVSCLSPNFAFSTLDMLEPQPELVELGKKFWDAVFLRNYDTAHELLASQFQTELPLPDFISAIAEIDLPDSSAYQTVQPDAWRFSNRLERTDPLSLVAIYRVQLQNGAHYIVQCEFAGPSESSQLTYFANDFHGIIAIEDQSEARELVATFLTGKPEAIQSMLDEHGRKYFAPDIAELFLRELKLLFDNQLPELQEVRVVREYQATQCNTHLSANLVNQQRSVHFEATTQAGKLKSFLFDAPELQSFLLKATSMGSLEEFGEQFLERWLKGNQPELAAEMMVTTDQWQALIERLSKQRATFLEDFGLFFWSDMISWSIAPTGNKLQAIYELEFANQTVDMELTFDVHAIGAKVSSAQLLSEVK